MRSFLLLVAVLGVIAALAPAPWYQTDREIYERLGQAMVLPDCSGLHCFRPAVPLVIEQLPGPSLLKWKMYAVVMNAAAALAASRFALAAGFPAPAATLAMWLSALGFGAMFTLFDVHTADPLMFALAPWLMIVLMRGRWLRAALVSAGGVLAKEFAAVPLWLMAAASALAGRWRAASRLAMVAAAVTLVWVFLQLALIVLANNTYGDSPSADLLHGGYLVYWVRTVGAWTALVSVLTEYGALYLLLPIGLWLAGVEMRRLALAAVPAVLAFAYVQQPDRALWNFHFLVTPLAALVLLPLPRPLQGLFVAAYAAANLRVGAQLAFVPAARFALALTVLIALAAIVRTLRSAERPRVVPVLTTDPAPARHAARRWRLAAAGVAAAGVVATMLVADTVVHARTDGTRGINRWGYRGPVMRHKQPGEVRIALVGGALAFGPAVEWNHSLAPVLQRYLKQGWRRGATARPVSVVSLARPGAPALMAPLDGHAGLDIDIVCIFAEPPAPGTDPRATSWLYRATGYLPAIGGPRHALVLEAAAAGAVALDEVVAAVRASAAAGKSVLLVSAPGLHPAEHGALAAAVEAAQSSGHRVRLLSLDGRLDLGDPAVAASGHQLTVLGHETLAEAMTDPLLAMIGS